MKKNPTKLEIKYNYNYDLIIRLYTMDTLYLSSSELNKYLKKRGEKQYPHYELIGKRRVLVYDKD